MRNETNKNLGLTDYEQALKACSSHLFIMYKANGGDAAERTTLALLGCIHGITPYLEELALMVVEASEHLPADKAKGLLDKIQPLLKVIKQGEIRNGNTE